MIIPSTVHFTFCESVWHCSPIGSTYPVGYGETPEVAYQDYVDSLNRDEESDKLFYTESDDFCYCKGPDFDDPLDMVTGRGRSRYDAWEDYLANCKTQQRNRMKKAEKRLADLQEQTTAVQVELNILRKKLRIRGVGVTF